MSNIKAEFVHVCEDSIIARNGNISIINIFDHIGVNTLPALFLKFQVVAGFRGQKGSYPVVIKVISPENSAIASAEGKADIVQDRGLNRFISTFEQIVFPELGVYRVEVSVAGEILESRELRIAMRE